MDDLVKKLEISFSWEGQMSNEELFNLWKENIQKIQELVKTGQASLERWDTYRRDKSVEAKNKGNSLLSSGNNEGAVLYFSLAILLDSSNYVFYSNRSAAYANLERYSEALADADKVVQLAPNWPKGYSRKGLACFFLKKYDESLAAYKIGLDLEPENEAIKQGIKQVESKVQDANEKGEELLAKGKPAEAIELFNKAVKLDPTESAFLSNRSDAYLRTGQADQALKDADSVIQLRPNWVKGFTRRGEALWKLNRYDEAASAYASASVLEPANTRLQTDMNASIQEGVRFRARQDMEAAKKKEDGKKDEKK